jgi:hypothetical protein
LTWCRQQSPAWPADQGRRNEDDVVTVTRELAERIAGLAQLLLSDDDPDATMRQLAELALEVIPGSDAGGVAVRNAALYRGCRRMVENGRFGRLPRTW